jgi:hypothetical protein
MSNLLCDGTNKPRFIKFLKIDYNYKIKLKIFNSNLKYIFNNFGNNQK